MGVRLYLLFAYFFFIHINILHGEEVSLTLLNLQDYPFARCLDGTVGGYYYQPATSNEFSKKYVIYLNGGGECDNEEDCLSQVNTSLGSSNYFASSVDTSKWYFGDDDCGHNKDFCQWNHIYDPYCSQDLHAGQRESANEWGLYFAGHHILDAILTDMDHKLKYSTEIIVTGASAGGLGLWMNIDWIAQRYPQARVTGASIAGLYFWATFYEAADATEPFLADFREAGVENMYSLYNAFVDQDCAKSLSSTSYACMFLNYSLPYINSDVFVIQAETDQVVLEGHDGFPGVDYIDVSPDKEFLQSFHANMSTALAPFVQQETLSSNGLKRRLGAFAAACYTHTDFTASHPKIQNLNYYQVFHEFYFSKNQSNDSDPSTYLLIDDCGEVCNPTCNAN